MPIFVLLFVIAFAFYIFYKIKYVRSKKPAEKKWLSAKGSIALGVFIALFGVNQLFLNFSTIRYVIGIIFIVLGGLNVWGGVKSYKFYLPRAIDEAEHLKKQS